MTPSRRDPQRETATNEQLRAELEAVKDRLASVEAFICINVARLAPDEWETLLSSIAERLKGDRT